MKKITLLLAALCLIVSGAIAQPAQLAKGNIMLGVTSTLSVGGLWGSDFVSFGFSTNKVNDGTTTEPSYKTTSWNFLPRAGYFVMDNLAAGIEVMTSGYMDKDVNDGDKDGESVFGVGPFVRYYYPLDKVSPFAEAEAVFGSYKETFSTDTYKEGLVMIGGGVGVAVPLGDKVSFDALVGYSHTSWKEKDVVEGDAYTYITGGFGLRLGFTVYLPL